MDLALTDDFLPPFLSCALSQQANSQRQKRLKLSLQPCPAREGGQRVSEGKKARESIELVMFDFKTDTHVM